MILNVSGRTDIVAFYMDWFVERWQEGYYDVRNPFDYHLVSRIFVKDVDMIVFCTKNPIPLLETIHIFPVPIQLQVTITGYFFDLETYVYNKTEIIKAVHTLSKIIGKENICIRYDPIILNEKYTAYYHIKAFQRLCTLISGAASKVIVSFVDNYKNVRENKLNYHDPTEKEYKMIKDAFEQTAEENDLRIVSCLEHTYHIGDENDCCISIKYAFERTGKLFKTWKARKCGCATMVDIGAYNSCLHGCRYCYANFDAKKIKENVFTHDIHSSLLLGKLDSEDRIKIRKK